MRNIVLALLATALMGQSVAAAQSTADNLSKYDALRDRLRSELISLGEGQGQGMPSHIRNDAMGYIRWADATIDLGWYIGVLATEHRMLATPSRFPGFTEARPIAETEEELYFALAAFERLDRVANASFDAPCTQSEELDGFFLRDDVPADFHTRFGLSRTSSDFIDTPATKKEMSQDQVWHLLMGLALTSELVAPGTTVRGRDLPSWALEQLERMMAHVASNDWVIGNPACSDRNVARGPAAIAYAVGATRALEFLTDGRVTHDLDRFKRALWNSLRYPDNAGYANVNNLHMAMVIAAVGGGFGPGTIDHLVPLAEREGWWAYPLLHVVLHGETGAPTWCEHRVRVNAATRTMLDELPVGAEPASPLPGRAPHSFTSSNRFIRGLDRAYTAEADSEGERYNGLDFMLLHNLHALATPSDWEGSDAPTPGACNPPPTDAGTVRADAGVSAADAGTGGGAEGCSCRARGNSPSGGFVFMLIAAALTRLRRRRA